MSTVDLAGVGDGAGSAEGSDGAAVDELWRDGEPSPVPVSAGDWALTLRGDALDDIRFQDVLILRSLRFIVRDHDWRTVPTKPLNVDITQTDDALELRIESRTEDADIHVDWTGFLRLQDGDLRFEVLGTARNSFRRNRIGLIVLHPPALAGVPLTIHSPTGSVAESAFSQRISPHQPALDVAGFDWVADGVAVELRLAGEVFETEDQRNWTDASFKTYSTPLSEPFPVLLEEGAGVRHQVDVSCRRVRPVEARQRDQVVTAGPARHPFPAMSVSASTAPGDPAAATATTLGARAVLVELELDAANWRAALSRADDEAGGLPLDVRLVASDPAQIPDAVAALADYTVTRIGVFDSKTNVTEGPLWDALAAALGPRGGKVERVAGSRAHFTELNRTIERLPTKAEALTYSVTAQMHDRGRHQVIESIAMQRLVALQAVEFSAAGRVHVGPITLRPRFNAVATSSNDSGPRSDDVDAGYGAQFVRDATDPRQQAPAAAAWLIASAAASAVPGVASLSYFETSGPRGLRGETGDYPVAEAFSWLAGLSGWDVVHSEDAPHGGLAVIIASRGTEVCVVAANLGSSPRDVLVDLGDTAESADGWEGISGTPTIADTPGIDLAVDGRLELTIPVGGAARWVGRFAATA